MRAKIGIVMAAFGLLFSVLGIALMIVLGPDSQITTSGQSIDTRKSVAVTSPKVLGWRGVTVTVLAEVPAQKPVFVGIGRQRDTQDYVRQVNRIQLQRFARPFSSHLVTRNGDDDHVPAAPTAMDWWLDSSAGVGGARMETVLPDEPVQLVIASVGSSNLSGLTVRVGYGIAGGFYTGAGMTSVGIGVVVWGRLLWRGRPTSWLSMRQRRTAVAAGPAEEITYIYVDDDGIEREVDEEAAQRLGILDDDVEIIDVSDVATRTGPSHPADGAHEHPTHTRNRPDQGGGEPDE